MPENTGRMPRHDKVDVILRCGHIVRGVDPTKWRWKPWPEGPSGGDIIRHQKSRET